MKYYIAIVILLVSEVTQCHNTNDEEMFVCKKIDSEFQMVVEDPKPTVLRNPKPTRRTKGKPKPTRPAKQDELEDRLQALENRVLELEEKATFEILDKDDVKPDQVLNEDCPIVHRNRCFLFIQRRGTIDLEYAENRCKELNGQLANIYDDNHLEKLEEYLRDHMSNGEEAEYFLTGMTYRRRGNDYALLKNDETPANFEKWYSDAYPSLVPGNNRIQVQVNKAETRESGMFNVSPDSLAKSALCQFPRKRMKSR